MDGNETFGRLLRRLRKAHDLTQEELGQQAYCAADTIKKIEMGLRRPSRQLAGQLADCFGLAGDDRAGFLAAARVGALSAPEPSIETIAPIAVAASDTRPRPNNLPAQPTALIGRAHEIASVCALLGRPDIRLITLTGTGGTGKTRLALQVASELAGTFRDGAWFVNLAPLSDPDLVATTIAQTLGVRESDRHLRGSLQDYLCEKQLLLLLDNFEQVVDAAPLIADLLAVAPGLKVLVTSRVVLHLSGEHEYLVPPLALPDPRQGAHVMVIATTPAVALFVARAQATQPAFMLTQANAAAVVEICRRLDGLPLALELAAARVKLLPPQALLARLDQTLKLLTGATRDAPARQQTIRNTIDWSYRLLDAGEQKLLARLGVFVGGWTLEAAEAVCNADGDLPFDVLDGLAALLDKSLLKQEEGVADEPRFTMLETIREYALERREVSGEVATLRRHHAAYCVALAEQAEPEFDGEQQRVWLTRLRQDYDNLRAALGWIIEQGAGDMGLRFVRALERFWFREAYHSEGYQWTTALIACARPAWSADQRAEALQIAGAMAWQQGDYVAARGPLEESTLIYRQLGDRSSLAHVLHILGRALLFQGEHEQARAILEECTALSQEVGDHSVLALSFQGRAFVAMYQADYRAARLFLEQCLLIDQTTGNQWGIAQTLNDLGDVARCEGDYAQAATLYQESLSRFQSQGIRIEIASILHNLGYVALAQGDQDRAHACFTESLALHREHINRPGILESLAGFGALLAVQGQPKQAARLFGAIAALRAALNAPMWPAERVEYERHMATARAQLDDATFDAAWATGQQLTLEDAIAEALVALDELQATAAVPASTPAVPLDDLAHELALAAEIQNGLLPASLPQPAGWQIAAALLPARETAGDFYDCFLLPDGRLALVIADVAGKGLGAALYMATGRALIRTLVPLGITAPAAVLAGVNARLLEDTHAGLFITAFFGVLDLASGTLTYANAGHPPPLLLADSARGAVELLNPTGLVLGVEPGVTWREETVVFGIGDRLLLYTDGVTEAQNAGGAFFETEQLLATLAAGAGDDVEAAVARVRAAVVAFAGVLPQFDDITLLAVQRVQQSND